jgi:hypothetical protein
MAAVLACGRGAVLSHRSAAALWGLLPRPTAGVGLEGVRIDVSIPSTAGRRRRAGIRLHRCPSLDGGSSRAPGLRRDLVTRQHEIPVTSPARTIADLRGVSSAAEMRQAIRRAEVLGLRTDLQPRRAKTRSELEDIFLAFCKRHRIPTPAVNVRVGPHEVDFTWPAARVAVETDSYGFHRGRSAFENDHERDLDLRAAGYDLVRLTYLQVTTAPDRAAAAVKDALRRSASAHP